MMVFSKRTFSLLMGSPATGKGSRLEILVNFLKTKFEHRIVHNRLDNKIIDFGVEFPDLGLIVIGTRLISHKNGSSGWSSLDYLNSTVRTIDGTQEMIRDYMLKNDTQHVIAEGEPLIISNKYRPTWMKDYFPIDSTFHMIFYYENKEQYHQRVIGRSGKPPPGDGAWRRNPQYRVYSEKVKSDGFTEGVDYVSGHLFDADHSIFGEKWLQYVGLVDLIDEFLEFSYHNNKTRANSQEIF